jgi:RimJ/RimL family protein N-acetyltransferase
MGLFSPFAQELETRRLLMRPWRLSDSEAIRGLWAERDPRSLHVIDVAGRPTVDDIRLRIQEQLEESTRTGLALLAIERKGEGDFVGYCGVIIGASTLAEPEIAYELCQSAHGNGYATEAAQAVLAAALDTGRRRLWATVRCWNAPSFRVLEKIGFARSGKIDRDPDRGDMVWMTGPPDPAGLLLLNL